MSFLTGVPPRMQLQARTLLKHGAHVRLVTWQPAASAPYDDGLASVDRIGVRTPIADSAVPFPIRGLRSAVRSIEYLARSSPLLVAVAKPGTVVQITHPLQLCATPQLTRRGAHVYYDLFEFYQMALESSRVGRGVARLCTWLEQRYVPALRGVSCVTSRDGWLAQRMRSLNPHVLEVPNYPSMVAETPLPHDAPELDRKRVVAYVGGLKHGKGLEVFPEIVTTVTASLPTAHFLIVGKVEAAQGTHGWMSEHRLAGRCTYIPWTSSGALRAWLERAEVGLVLSQRRQAGHRAVGAGNGRKLFTYLASGLPVVAPDFSSAWALVTEEGVGIQVDTEKPAEVAGAILRLLTDDEMRSQMSEAARRSFLERYNWESQERRWLEFYGFGHNGAPSP